MSIPIESTRIGMEWNGMDSNERDRVDRHRAFETNARATNECDRTFVRVVVVSPVFACFSPVLRVFHPFPHIFTRFCVFSTRFACFSPVSTHFYPFSHFFSPGFTRVIPCACVSVCVPPPHPAHFRRHPSHAVARDDRHAIDFARASSRRDATSRAISRSSSTPTRRLARRRMIHPSGVGAFLDSH